MKQQFTIKPGAAAERLDVYLAAALDASRSAAQKLLRAGAVSVNRQPGKASYLLQPGDQVEVTHPEPPAVSRIAPDLPVIYEDPDIIVIDKPAGVVAHAGSATGGLPTVAEFARSRTTDPDPDRPGIVHRLDRDTSGLMVIAKTPAAKDFLQDQFRAGHVQKTYTLLAVGRVRPAEAVIKLPLDRDPANPLRRAVVAGGRPAVTHYRTLAEYSGYSLVEARPATGRTHQLRVHFAATGHPVAGDITYGLPKRQLGLTRQFLHATRLEFTAPSGKKLLLHSPLPPELSRVVQALARPV